MRAVPQALATAIESGAAQLCTAWILTRRDGLRLGFTDHDEPLAVEGVTCAAASGWTLGAADSEAGFDAGSATATGALDSALITEGDIAAGSYDGAQVEAWRLDWSDPAGRVRLWRGTIARLLREGIGFTAEIEGPLSVLRRVAGRTYGRTCDARLGDARCRVDLTAPGFADAVCDHRFETCGGRFGNTANFQGFPDIPGDDWLAAYPVAGGVNDGSSRR